MPEPRRVRLDEDGMPIRREDVPAPEPPAACDCPHLEPEDWDGVESDWTDIAFVSGSTSAVLGVPVGYGGVEDELRKKAVAAGGTVPEDAMLLNGSGKFRRPVMLEVEGENLHGKDVVRPGGIAFTRLVEAPWGELPKAADRLVREATERYGRKPDATWVWYLTCRECSRERNFETLLLAHYREKP